MAERRRTLALVGVLAAVLLAALVIGLGLLLRPDEKKSATGVSPETSPTPSATSPPPTTAAPWLRFARRLPWAAPALGEGHQTVRVSDRKSTRRISLKDEEDCLVVLPSEPLTDYGPVDTGDAMVTVTGGRNVVVIGGQITIPRGPVARLTVPVTGAEQDTLTVDSTRGFPRRGVLRVDGEGVRYTSRDATHFYVDERDYGFFNDSPVSSRAEHERDAEVYLHERNRSGLSFVDQTGTVHVEGVLIDGAVNDGIRVAGGEATLQVQRTHIGPVTNFDLEHQTDGHPDGIQAYGGGAALIRLAQVTVELAENGNGLLNKGSDSGDAVPRWQLQDVELVSPTGRARSLIANSDESTAWDVRGGWLRSAKGQRPKVTDSALERDFRVVTYEQGQRDIVPTTSVGREYRLAQ